MKKILANLKDYATSFAAVLTAIGGLFLALIQAGIVLPEIYHTLGIALPIVSMFIVGIFVGKNPNGSTKTPEQIAEQNSPTTK